MIGKSKFSLKFRQHQGKENQMDLCAVQPHNSKEFTPETRMFYIKENESKAFIQPAFSTEGLPPTVISTIQQFTMMVKER